MTYIVFQNNPGFLDMTISQNPLGLAVIPIGTRDLPLLFSHFSYVAQAVPELPIFCLQLLRAAAYA